MIFDCSDELKLTADGKLKTCEKHSAFLLKISVIAKVIVYNIYIATQLGPRLKIVLKA